MNYSKKVLISILGFGLFVAFINLMKGFDGIEGALNVVMWTFVVLFFTSVVLVFLGKRKFKERSTEIVFAIATAPFTLVFLWFEFFK